MNIINNQTFNLPNSLLNNDKSIMKVTQKSKLIATRQLSTADDNDF